MATISGSRVLRATIIIIRLNKLTFDGDNELRNYRKNLSTTLLKHVEDSLYGKESVGIHLLTDTLEEDWKVVMVVQLLDLNFPVNAELRTVFDGDR